MVGAGQLRPWTSPHLRITVGQVLAVGGEGGEGRAWRGRLACCRAKPLAHAAGWELAGAVTV